MKRINLEKKKMNIQNLTKSQDKKNDGHESFNFLSLKNDNLQFIKEFENKKKAFQKKFSESMMKFKNKAKYTLGKE